MSRGGCSSRTTVALFVVGLLVQLGFQLDLVWFRFGLFALTAFLLCSVEIDFWRSLSNFQLLVTSLLGDDLGAGISA